MQPARVSARPKLRSASRNRTRPPSDEIRPPSKAAVTFLRWTLGRSTGRRLSSVMAGVAFSLFGEEDARKTNSYPMATAYATSATPKADPPRIIRVRIWRPDSRARGASQMRRCEAAVGIHQQAGPTERCGLAHCHRFDRLGTKQRSVRRSAYIGRRRCTHWRRNSPKLRRKGSSSWNCSKSRLTVKAIASCSRYDHGVGQGCGFHVPHCSSRSDARFRGSTRSTIRGGPYSR